MENGKKSAIDSSTLFNKILELIEAQKLFNIPLEKLDVIIHLILVHAVVIFNNGTTKMLYHPTTMIIPIANAILDGKLNIDDYYVSKTKNEIESYFSKVDLKISIIRLKQKKVSSIYIYNSECD